MSPQNNSSNKEHARFANRKWSLKAIGFLLGQDISDSNRLTISSSSQSESKLNDILTFRHDAIDNQGRSIRLPNRQCNREGQVVIRDHGGTDGATENELRATEIPLFV